jgi:hypothetical protein
LGASPGCVETGGEKSKINERKSMKKLFLGLSLIALLAGCASHENENGMGGTSDQNYKTDQYNNNNPSDQSNNNATHGTGTDTGTNSATGQGMNNQ